MQARCFGGRGLAWPGPTYIFGSGPAAQLLPLFRLISL